MMKERTRYQEKVIRNYYEHRDEIALQRLGEMVTNLYLAEGKARARLWTQARGSLEKLNIPATRIEHLVKSDSPELLAQLLNELLGRPGK